MAGIFSHLKDLFEDDPETADYSYNYTYLPPLAMIDAVPPSDVSADWLTLATTAQIEVTLNMIAVVDGRDMTKFKARLDHLKEKRGRKPAAWIIAELVFLFRQVAQEIGHLLGPFLEDLNFLLADLTDDNANVVVILLKINQGFQNSLLKGKFNRHLPNQEAYDKLFVLVDRPEISKTWSSDETFANLRVAGPNPMTLARLDAALPNFPVTNAMYQQTMGADDDLDTAMQEGRVYVVNYKLLEGLLTGSYMGPQKYLGAPIAMFAVPKEPGTRRLKPVAIQCGQIPGDDFPIWTPPKEPNTSDAYAWEMAKIFFNACDGNFHEAVAHLGWTHMVMSPFSVATANTLGTEHPVGKLITPHFQGTFSINNAAAKSLIYSEGIIDQIMAGTIDASRATSAAGAWMRTRNFQAGFLPNDLAQRGVADKNALPYYPYRDCAEQIWAAIEQWVADYLGIIYPTEDGPAKDTALQNWLHQLTVHEGGRVGLHQENKKPTRTYLTGVLTMVMFTSSAQHAAVNFPQLGVMSYPPAMPLAVYTPPPRAGATYTQQSVMKMLPPLAQAIIQLNTGTLLGGLYYTRLGAYDKGWFKDPRVLNALSAFQARLQEVETDIKKTFPEYPYLLPSEIPQSINI